MTPGRGRKTCQGALREGVSMKYLEGQGVVVENEHSMRRSSLALRTAIRIFHEVRYR
jgi:hypothetical protein